MPSQDWSDGTTVKSTDCPFRGLGFNPQQYMEAHQGALPPFPEAHASLLAYAQTGHVPVHSHTCRYIQFLRCFLYFLSEANTELLSL